MPSTVASRDNLRQSLDASVAVARAVAVLGCAGRIAAVAAAAWAGMLLVIRILPLAGGPSIGDRWLLVAAAAAAALASLPLFRTVASAWPSRLAIAIAAERMHPQLGESISRAIEFLEDKSETAAPGQGSAALRALAAERAAEAAAGIGRLPVPGLRANLLSAVSGAVAVALVAAVTSATAPARTTADATRGLPAATTVAGVPAAPRSIAAATRAVWQRIESLRGRLAGENPPTPGEAAAAIGSLAADSRQSLAAAGGRGSVLTAFAHTLSQLERDLTAPRGAADVDPLTMVRKSLDELSALARTAVRIADTASFERRLAALSAEWFALAPGEEPGGLPAPIRAGLDQAAALAGRCAEEIAVDRATLVHATHLQPSDADGISRAATLIAAIEATSLAGMADDIRGNRLAIAAESADRVAASLEQVADLLGMNAAASTTGPALNLPRDPAANPSSMQVARELLDRLPEAIVSASQAVEPGATAAVAPSDTRRPTTPATTAGGSPGIDGSTAATSPRSGTVTGPRTEADTSAAVNAGDEAWRLLQEQSFPQRPQAGELLAFPSHRQAIDAYYRLLLKSAAGRKQPSSQP